ncbi:hypothetical protein [Nocardia sp. Marseille-Q1738]
MADTAAIERKRDALMLGKPAHPSDCSVSHREGLSDHVHGLVDDSDAVRGAAHR